MNKFFLEHSIADIAAQLDAGKLEPQDLTAASLENIRELDETYHAWVTYRTPAAPRSSGGSSQPSAERPLLPGIPVGIKDIFNTVDFPTQMGSHLWKDFTPGNDARAVFNLKRQGAAVVGKTVTAEFAVHALNETLNPHDSTRTPGTSSSGSAVAIALGMVPLATGTQTAGSIVRPASFCGVYGCKPSFGFVPRTGTLKTTDSLDTIGFFVAHEEDLKRSFDALRVSGKDYPISDAAINDVSRQHKPENRPWRVAFTRTHTWEHAPPYARDSLEQCISKLSNQKGIEIIDGELPELMRRAHEVHAIIYNKSLSYYFKGEHTQSDFVSPIMNELIASGAATSVEQFREAIDTQNSIIRGMDAFFGGIDVLVSLSTAGEAPARDVAELPDPALMWTLAHLPVVSVPQFKSPNGLPFGMQVAARKYNDYLLFEFLDHLRSLAMIPAASGYFV